MRPIATVVEWYVCLLVMGVSRAETAKLIKTPFEMWTRKSLRNHVLGETRISHTEWILLVATLGHGNACRGVSMLNVTRKRQQQRGCSLLLT